MASPRLKSGVRSAGNRSVTARERALFQRVSFWLPAHGTRLAVGAPNANGYTNPPSNTLCFDRLLPATAAPPPTAV